MTTKQYIKSQNDCVKLLGQSFDDYNKSIEKIKYSKFTKSFSKEKQVNKILNELGLIKKDLKK